MRLELSNVLGLECAWHAALKDGVHAARQVTAKSHAHLGLQRTNLDADRPQIINDGGFFVATPAEHPQDSAGERWLDRKAEVQPQPAIAGVADYAATHVRAGHLLCCLRLMVLVNQRGNAILCLGNLHDSLLCSVQFGARQVSNRGCRRRDFSDFPPGFIEDQIERPAFLLTRPRWRCLGAGIASCCVWLRLRRQAAGVGLPTLNLVLSSVLT